MVCSCVSWNRKTPRSFWPLMSVFIFSMLARLDQSMLSMDHSMMSAPSALAIATVLASKFPYGGRM